MLIIGSGSFTHDLSEIFRNRFPKTAPLPDWVSRFAEWFDEALQHGDVERLIGYRPSAPFAVLGALAAARRGLDLFGVLVVAFVASCFGGIARDILIGAFPPRRLGVPR